MSREEIAPLRLISKLRNNRMIRAREAIGMSGPQVSKAIGVNYSHWILLESLKESPLRVDGQWRSVALRISDWFKVMPEDLWPAEALAVERSTMEIEVSAIEARVLMGSTQQAALPDYRAELEVDGLESALKTLTPRQEKILRMRFGLDGNDPKTLDEVGEEFQVSGSRIREIENKALRLLRSPSRAQQIICVDEAPVTPNSDQSITRCQKCRSPLTRKSPEAPYKCGCGMTVIES